MSLPTGEVTFVFTDIEGSTRLIRELGERYALLSAQHHQLLAAAALEHRGVVVQTEGDGAFLAFSDAGDGLRFAVAAQRALAAHPWPDVAPRVRMGVHTGPAVPEAGGYVSLTVHEASRVAGTGHGGQIVVSDASVLAAGGQSALALRPLGRFRLRDLPEPLLLHQLEAEGLASGFPALRAIPAAGHNLPPARDAFVGRAAEREAVADAASARVVTVCGPGGIGKTRLVCEVALQWTERFPDGIWFVDLGSVEATAVPGAIAATLGLADLRGDPISSLAAALSAQRSVVVLDGVEGVLDAVRPLADQVLAAAGDNVLLVTSRAPLALSGERVVRLGPLDLPPDGASAERIAASGAAQLFVTRARLADPDLQVDDAAAWELVARICRRVGAMPLGIELAAAQARALDLIEIADEGPASPGSGAREPPDPLAQAIERTFGLLPPAEREAWTRLSVHQGWFDLRQARCLLDGGESDVRRLVVALVDWSVLQRRSGALAPYRFLDPLRDAGWRRATQAGVNAELLQCHTAGVEAAVTHQQAREQSSLDELSRRRAWVMDIAPDVRQGLATAFSHGAHGRAEQIVGGLASDWRDLGWAVEWTRWAHELLAHDGPPTDQRAAVLEGVAASAYSAGDRGAEALNDAALAMATERGLSHLVVSALLRRVGFTKGRGRAATDAAVRALEDLAAQSGDERVRVVAAVQRCAFHRAHNDLTSAQRTILALFDRPLPAAEARTAHLEAAMLALELDQLAEAEHHLNRSLEHAEAVGSARGRATALRQLGYLAVRQGRLDIAAARLRTATDAVRAMGQLRNAAVGLLDQAWARLAAGDPWGGNALAAQALLAGQELVAPRERASMHLCRAVAFLALEDDAAGAAALDAARVVALDEGAADVVLHATELTAVLAARAGDLAEAGAQLSVVADSPLLQARAAAAVAAALSAADTARAAGFLGQAGALRALVDVIDAGVMSRARWPTLPTGVPHIDAEQVSALVRDLARELSEADPDAGRPPAYAARG